MRKHLHIILLALALVLLVSCVYDYTDESILTQLYPTNDETVQVGDIIHFGNHDWVVLSIYENNTALIIVEDVITKNAFHDTWESVTWETSDLRTYLNSVFLNTFTQEEKIRILPRELHTPNNAWYGTRGGNDTMDYIFLLSIEEVVKYFGDSGQLRNPAPPQYGIHQAELSDEYNLVRIGFDENGVATWWYLRSPGFDYDAISIVNMDGSVNISGVLVGSGSSGVRPAMLLTQLSHTAA